MEYLNTADSRAVCSAIENALEPDDVSLENIEVDREELDEELKKILAQISDDTTYLADKGYIGSEVKEVLDDLATMVQRIYKEERGGVHVEDADVQLADTSATDSGRFVDRLRSELEDRGFKLVRAR